MGIEELMERISLPKEARQAVRKENLTEAEYTEEKQLFYDNFPVFFENWKKETGKEKYTRVLVFYLHLACEVYPKYKEKGIEDAIFDKTFYDITIWCEECYRKHQVYGLEELWWLAQSVKMNLFRLGRLQFEPIVLEKDIHTNPKLQESSNISISAGTKVLNVHIPAGEPLDYEACLDSFRQAEAFFGKNQIYMCDSWLLSPHLKEVLSEESNILKFQNLFTVTSVYYAYPQAEQRIFQNVIENKQEYPEDTSLRRRAKAYILLGKDLGIGIGIIENIYKYI